MKCVLQTLLLCSVLLFSKAHGSVFIGYEFGEMAFNDFKHFAGEIGYSLKDNKAVRVSVLNIALSEEHLSSNSARSVDGDNVFGLWRGLELFYDQPIRKNLSWSITGGYFDTEYQHTQLTESVTHKTASIGVALSYGEPSLFGINNLYWRFTLPLRYYFKPLDRTMLGDAVINRSTYEYNPWIYIGYRFN